MKLDLSRKRWLVNPNPSREHTKIDTADPGYGKEKSQAGKTVSSDTVKRDRKGKINPLDILSKNKI